MRKIHKRLKNPKSQSDLSMSRNEYPRRAEKIQHKRFKDGCKLHKQLSILCSLRTCIPSDTDGRIQLGSGNRRTESRLFKELSSDRRGQAQRDGQASNCWVWGCRCLTTEGRAGIEGMGQLGRVDKLYKGVLIAQFQQMGMMKCKGNYLYIPPPRSNESWA